jgi:prolipoprotein diacylglyceryltransferase
MAFGWVFWIIGIICAVWVISDVWTKQKKMKDSHKILWTVLAVVFSIITAIIYYFVVYKK